MPNYDCTKCNETTETLNEDGFCESCLCVRCHKGDFERYIKCVFCKKPTHLKCSLLTPWYILDYTATGTKFKCEDCTKNHAVSILTNTKKKSDAEIQSMLHDIQEYLNEGPAANKIPLPPPPSPPQTASVARLQAQTPALSTSRLSTHTPPLTLPHTPSQPNPHPDNQRGTKQSSGRGVPKPANQCDREQY